MTDSLQRDRDRGHRQHRRITGQRPRGMTAKVTAETTAALNPERSPVRRSKARILWSSFLNPNPNALYVLSICRHGRRNAPRPPLG